MSAGMDASVAPAFCHPASFAALLRHRQHALLACCLRPLCLLLCLLIFCPVKAGAEGDIPPAPPAPSLSLELEQLDLSGLPGLPPLPAEDEVLPAAATHSLPLTEEAPAAAGDAEADAALPEAPRWNALEEGLEYAEFSLQSEAGQQASLTVLRIDPELFDFRLYASAAHKHPALTLGQWADSHDLVAAINASMYLPDGVTSTGYMRQDDYINNKRLVRRFGAFFVAGPRQEGLPRADILTREDPQWQELLEQYRQEGTLKEKVACVVTDIEMPQMDGHRLLKLIKETPAYKDIPVIIFSSLINEEMRHKGEQLGADAQLSKHEMAEFVKELDRVLA